MSDEQATEKSDVKKQKLWPIFLVAFLLAGFGFYVVFATERVATEAPGERAKQAVAGEPLVLEGEPAGQTIELEYSRAVRVFRVRMTQKAIRPSGETLTTTLSFRLRDEPAAPKDGEALAFRRTFVDARVTLERDGEAYGREITNEVVRLLEAAVLEVGLTDDGQLVRTEVVSSESAQMRPTLNLVGDALRFVFPSLPAEPVNVGESWSSIIPSKVDGSDALTVEGGLELQAEVAKVTESGALLMMTVDGSTRSTWDDGEENSGHVEVTHRGEGEWIWDREARQPMRARWELSRQTRDPAGSVLDEGEIVILVEADDAEGPGD